MTTQVIVKANHGWPVKVTGIDPKTGRDIPNMEWDVPANEEKSVHVHSTMDIRVHEVQPEEQASKD